MMMDSVDFWHWLILAVLLIALEIMISGAFFLWLGVSASVVGLVLWIFPDMSGAAQLLLFALTAVISITLWRVRLSQHPTESEDDTLNTRTAQYIGRIFTLVEPIIDGYGKIRVDDSYWQVNGPDCEKDKKVKVISTDGMVLKVEPV